MTSYNANCFTAVRIVEGLEEANETEQLAAWQLLVDTGLVWQLQGSFGRRAANLIEEGLISNEQATVLAYVEEGLGR